MSEWIEEQLNEQDTKPIAIMQATCRVCGLLKDRVPFNKKYYDLNKKRWNGRMCPQCNKEFSKSNMSKLRTDRREMFSEEWEKHV